MPKRIPQGGDFLSPEREGAQIAVKSQLLRIVPILEGLEKGEEQLEAEEDQAYEVLDLEIGQLMGTYPPDTDRAEILRPIIEQAAKSTKDRDFKDKIFNKLRLRILKEE